MKVKSGGNGLKNPKKGGEKIEVDIGMEKPFVMVDIGMEKPFVMIVLDRVGGWS